MDGRRRGGGKALLILRTLNQEAGRGTFLDHPGREHDRSLAFVHTLVHFSILSKEPYKSVSQRQILLPTSKLLSLKGTRRTLPKPLPYVLPTLPDATRQPHSARSVGSSPRLLRDVRDPGTGFRNLAKNVAAGLDAAEFAGPTVMSGVPY